MPPNKDNDDDHDSVEEEQSDEEDHNEAQEGAGAAAIDDEIDDDTLRIMVSTDNHLGFCERDPIRGLDSFAAFEEVLALAKRHKCDMVLLAGDLFHDNKPSRRTMHKAMEIIRRYCMGPDPVQFHIVSNQATNFRSINGKVNYEDEYYSVDLPIFSIHGNHDDPTREGGTEMLAALDLLAVTNLVNYFGRQDEVDKVEVSPVLLRKGKTKVALYGMGSMRDERLNRMWQGKKVRFLRPENSEEDDNDGEDAESNWFNIFALHQNRDLGRGAKCCVHESMIPEWMDLVVWGHEHECQIEIDESAVGTFRITQPGSSVATSLISGEAVRKQVGILDIRGNQFRMNPLPLSQVRAFSIAEISLQNNRDVLDPEDPKVDDKIADLLAKHISLLVEDAREKSRILREDAEEAARAASAAAIDNFEGDNSSSRWGNKQKFKLEAPDQVLVRLKVEHLGFSTLNNQRFGARFVGEVANPSELLLFHRRRQVESVKSDDAKGTHSKKGAKSILGQPLAPDELAEMNVEDLVRDNLVSADKKLELLDEHGLGLALDDFVSKEQRAAIQETVSDTLKKQQKKLINREFEGNSGSKITTAEAVHEVCKMEAEKKRAKAAVDDEEGIENKLSAPAKRKRDDENNDDNALKSNGVDYGSDDSFRQSTGRKRARNDSSSQASSVSSAKNSKSPSSGKPSSSARASRQKGATTSSRRSSAEQSDSDDVIEIVETVSAPKSYRQNTRPTRQAASSSRNKGRYTYDDDDDDMEDSDARGGDDSDEVVSVKDEDDDGLSDMEEVEELQPKKKSRGTAAVGRKTATKRARLTIETPPSTKKGGRAAFTSSRRRNVTTSSRKNAKRSTAYYDNDSDDDHGGKGIAGSLGMAGGWGTAATESSQSRRSRR